MWLLHLSSTATNTFSVQLETQVSALGGFTEAQLKPEAFREVQTKLEAL